MKAISISNIKLILAVFVFLFAAQINAQRVSVNININSHHGPSHENDRCYEDEPEYFYYPEIEAYFDIHNSVYIYLDHGKWIRSRYLPRHCSDYNVQRGYRVVIDYHGGSPYNNFHNHQKKYKCKRYESCCDRKYKHKYHKKHKKNHHDRDDD